MKRFDKAMAAMALLAVVTVVVAATNLPRVSAKEIGSLFSASQPASANQSAATVNLALNSAVSAMNSAISADPDGISAAATLVDVGSGKTYNAGATGTIYKAASTAKVLAAVDYLHEVEQGNDTLTQTIDGMTAEQAMQQMIEVSDNTAWSDINAVLGDQQQSYATSLGMSSFTGGEYNTMTASDEAKLLTQLAEGKLLTNADRAILYGYMANTDSSNLIPAALPSGTTVYHKYGELWGNLHDAAIIIYRGHTYVLVVYTNNTDGTMDEYDDQVALIHAITKAAFQGIIPQ